MTNSPDERGAELRELFYETSQELLQALNDEALKLEKHPGDEEIVRSIRRTVHTLKGDSAACGLRELSELAHQFEDALSLEGAVSHAAVAETARPGASRRTPARRLGPLPSPDPPRRPQRVAPRARVRQSGRRCRRTVGRAASRPRVPLVVENLHPFDAADRQFFATAGGFSSTFEGRLEKTAANSLWTRAMCCRVGRGVLKPRTSIAASKNVFLWTTSMRSSRVLGLMLRTRSAAATERISLASKAPPAVSCR